MEGKEFDLDYNLAKRKRTKMNNREREKSGKSHQPLS